MTRINTTDMLADVKSQIRELKKAYDEQGMTPTLLERESGVHRTIIYDIFFPKVRGKKKYTPTIETMAKIARALGRKAEYKSA